MKNDNMKLTRREFIKLGGIGGASALLYAAIKRQRRPTTNLLANPSFESHAFTHDALRCADGTCAIVQRENIFSPEGWMVWYVEGEPCSAPYVTGQPEGRTTTLIIDPARVHSGSQAYSLFTFWRCHHAGLYQTVNVIPGEYYRASAFAHAWYSRCSAYPHGQPLEEDCETLINWAHDHLYIGLDASGGTDPYAPGIVWPPAHEVYGLYGDALHAPVVKAAGPTMTVWLRSITSHPLKHCDTYWDDAVMERVDVVWLPVVRR